MSIATAVQPETQVWWVKPLTAWVATVLVRFKAIFTLWKASPYTFYHVCFARNLKSVWNELKEGFTDISWSYTPTALHRVGVTIRCWRGRRSEKEDWYNAFTVNISFFRDKYFSSGKYFLFIIKYFFKVNIFLPTFSLCSFHFSIQALGQTVWKFLAKKLQGSYSSHFSFWQRWKSTWFCQQFLETLPKAQWTLGPAKYIIQLYWTGVTTNQSHIKRVPTRLKN